MRAEAGLPAASRPPPGSQRVRVHEGVQGPSAARVQDAWGEVQAPSDLEGRQPTAKGF